MWIRLNCRALAVGLAVALLIACAGLPTGNANTPALPLRAKAPTLAPSGDEVLYRFRAGNDGNDPVAGLSYLNGNYYGTTLLGGPHGRGTIFSVTSSGKERIIHRFNNDPDCAAPYSKLISVKGTLYGTALTGGANDYGCVFTVTASGNEKVLYSFRGSSSGDGANPHSDLVGVNGTLYGTTESGGANNKGTVFKITPSGSEQVIYSFEGGEDGDAPHAGLINVNGTLFGTTAGRGSGSGSLWGTVFALTTSGKEKVLYSFQGPPDGADPEADLVEMNGILYGTTNEGGEAWGTVFSVTTSGKEEVLHSFAGFADGAYPYAALVVVKNSLYGITKGGRNSECSYFGCGTIYSITASGTETVLYNFNGNPDGAYPEGGLLVHGKALYGTTTGGGYGYGTVFRVAPAGETNTEK